MRQRCAIAGLAVLAASVMCFLIASSPREATYKGKPLRYWVKGYRAGNTQWNDSWPERADTAVRQIGTNGIPTLLRMLAAKDSEWDMRLLNWSVTWRGWAQRQHFVKIARGPHLRSYEPVEASSAFRALGPEASCALPDLIRLLGQDLPSNNHAYVVLTIGGIGPAAKQAVPLLLRELRDPTWRGNALYALGRIHTDSKVVVPEITKALQETDSYVREMAARALMAYGPRASSAVPALVEALRRRYRSGLSFFDPEDPLAAALKAIDPEAAAKAGVK